MFARIVRAGVEEDVVLAVAEEGARLDPDGERARTARDIELGRPGEATEGLRAGDEDAAYQKIEAIMGVPPVSPKTERTSNYKL